MTSIPRRAAHRDCNEVPIIRVFQEAGAVVEMLSGAGTPDLLVSFLGVLHLIEVKWENAGLTETQKAWHRDWHRQGGAKVEIVRTEAQARKLVRMWTQEFAGHQPTLDDDLAYPPPPED